MDRALILHVGHRKTGTSTLQRLIFPQFTRVNYFCKDATPASRQLIHAFMYSPAIWRHQGEQIFRQLLADISDRQANCVALISSEGMSTHRIFATPGFVQGYRRDPFLLAAHLRECLAVAQRVGFTALKVIMGIRRQDQYLSSEYATGGYLAPEPGHDFEQQILQILDFNDRYFVDGAWLDYKMTLDLMTEAVGDNNVLMLPLEQLDSQPHEYLERLAAFVGHPLKDPILGHKNVRRVAPDVWQIDGKSMRRGLRKKRFGRLRSLLARPVEIRLSPELKQRILATYRESNQSLASSLNLDLVQYGYYSCGSRD